MSMETLRFKNCINLLRKLDKEMQLQAVLILILIAEGSKSGHYETCKSLEEKVGISSASCSRNVAVLSKWNRHDILGHDLVVNWENPKKRVEKFIKLTLKGEMFMKELENTIKGGR